MEGSNVTKLAKLAAQEYVRHNRLPEINWALPPDLAAQRACYVTILENPGRRFRVMWGYPFPQQSCLAQEIMVNAVEAIRRQITSNVRKADLPYLVYSVAVLGPMERVTSSAHLNPGVFGLYLSSDRRKSAILLPQRTGIETPDEQIATALRESGVDTSQEAVTMYRFQVRHYD